MGIVMIIRPARRTGCGTLRARRFKQSGLGYLGRQGIKRRLHNLPPESGIAFRSERGVSANVLNAGAFDHPGGSGGEREAEQRRYNSDGNTCVFDPPGYRCAATITGASGGDQQRAVDLLAFQVLRHFIADPDGVADVRADT